MKKGGGMGAKEIVHRIQMGDRQELWAELPRMATDDRRIALQELVKGCDETCTGALAEVAMRDSDQLCRFNAVRGLGRIGGAEAEAALLDVVGTETDKSVLLRAMRALEGIASQRAIPVLSDLASRPDVAVCSNAVSLLTSLDLTPEVIEELKRHLDDPKFSIRLAAITALAGGDDRGAYNAARESARGENLFVRFVFWAREKRDGRR